MKELIIFQKLVENYVTVKYPKILNYYFFSVMILTFDVYFLCVALEDFLNVKLLKVKKSVFIAQFRQIS